MFFRLECSRDGTKRNENKEKNKTHSDRFHRTISEMLPSAIKQIDTWGKITRVWELCVARVELFFNYEAALHCVCISVRLLLGARGDEKSARIPLRATLRSTIARVCTGGGSIPILDVILSFHG
uniref:(northern house mosquito) hypothetical protein n=1 Tax=Culex pipiens TaxID=7175 RepID=A0A8D8FKQ0_CULPI